MYFHLNQSNSDRKIVCDACGKDAVLKLVRRRNRNGRTECCNAKWWTESA